MHSEGGGKSREKMGLPSLLAIQPSLLGSSLGKEFEAQEDGQELCSCQDDVAGLGRPCGAFRCLIGRLMGKKVMVNGSGVVEDGRLVDVAVNCRFVTVRLLAVGGCGGHSSCEQFCKERVKSKVIGLPRRGVHGMSGWDIQYSKEI